MAAFSSAKSPIGFGELGQSPFQLLRVRGVFFLRLRQGFHLLGQTVILAAQRGALFAQALAALLRLVARCTCGRQGAQHVAPLR